MGGDEEGGKVQLRCDNNNETLSTMASTHLCACSIVGVT